MQMRMHLIKEGISAEARNRASLKGARKNESMEAEGGGKRERESPFAILLPRTRCYLYSDRFPIIREYEQTNEETNKNHGGNDGKKVGFRGEACVIEIHLWARMSCRSLLSLVP